MDPVIISFGSFEVRWYSLLIVISLIIGYFGVLRESKRFNIDKNFLINVIFWAVLLGIIGARVYYVIFNLPYYLQNIGEIFKLWHGGLAIHGGILLGALAIIVYCKKYRFNVGKLLDIFAPFLLLAQAIGRWGNFFNQEAYGSLTTLQRLEELFIPKFVINGMYINGYYYLPMFYFESLWCILGVIALLILRRIKKIKNGQIACIYLMWYSIGRFFIEIYRTDSLLAGNLKAAQIISIVLFLIGFIFLIITSKKKDYYNEINKEKKKGKK